MAQPDFDHFGDGVTVAARLEPLAEPGSLSVSRSVHDQVRDKLPYRFEDDGKLSLKNIPRPIRVFALSGVAVQSRALPIDEDDDEDALDPSETGDAAAAGERAVRISHPHGMTGGCRSGCRPSGQSRNSTTGHAR